MTCLERLSRWKAAGALTDIQFSSALFGLMISRLSLHTGETLRRNEGASGNF